MTSVDDGARIVLTDFGHARYLPAIVEINGPNRRQRMFSVAGTVGFAAP